MTLSNLAGIENNELQHIENANKNVAYKKEK